MLFSLQIVKIPHLGTLNEAGSDVNLETKFAQILQQIPI